MVTVRLPEDLKARIDVARGDVPRERWVRRALERALGGAPFPVVVENVAHNERGEFVRADPSKPSRYEEKRPASEPVEGTPLPKIARRHWAS